MNKKIASLLLVSTLMIGSINNIGFAAEDKGLVGQGNAVPAVLTAEQLSFNVTVPTILPVDVGSDGVVTVAKDVRIKNNSNGPVKITGVQLDSQGDWVLGDYTTDFSREKVGLHKYGFQILGSNADSVTGNCDTTGISAIAGKNSMVLDYTAKIAPQKEGLTNEVISKIVFTIGWDTMVNGGGSGESHEYILATDADFSGTADGSFKYIGTDKYVEIPHIIKGVPITSYYIMFISTSVEGVKSTNNNVTDMNNMFAHSTAINLDISNLDTSNVTHMGSMFAYSQATNINFGSNFDTSNVTNMSWMFSSSKLTALDLSSFDTSNVTNMDGMFSLSTATTGYARTQSDANKFNTSFNKPPTLTFVVK